MTAKRKAIWISPETHGKLFDLRSSQWRYVNDVIAALLREHEERLKKEREGK